MTLAIALERYLTVVHPFFKVTYTMLINKCSDRSTIKKIVAGRPTDRHGRKRFIGEVSLPIIDRSKSGRSGKCNGTPRTPERKI